MRIYLKEKQVEPWGDTGATRVWDVGFYQMNGEAREKKAKAWIEAGIALPATEDNQIAEVEDKPEVAETTGLIPNNGPSVPGWDGNHYTPSISVKEKEDNG